MLTTSEARGPTRSLDLPCGVLHHEQTLSNLLINRVDQEVPLVSCLVTGKMLNCDTMVCYLFWVMMAPLPPITMVQFGLAAHA